MAKKAFGESTIQRYSKKHGKYVFVPKSNMVLFEDGAQCENTAGGTGFLNPPPKDEWERAKLISSYWEIIATAAENEFNNFKSYLLGTGVGPPGIDTEEEKIAHLKELKANARAAINQFRNARKEVKATEPFWLQQRRMEGSRQRRQQDELLEQVRNIEL